MVYLSSDDVYLKKVSVEHLDKKDKFNLAYSEMGLYIDHYSNECIIKETKKDLYNKDVINRYLNNGIYPFYKMMFSENLSPSKKIQIVNEIYHYMQVSDFVFFESIKDKIDVYRLTNNRVLDRFSAAQEMFALKSVNLNPEKNNELTFQDVMGKKGIIRDEDFKLLHNYIKYI